jgi:hypothetical protein
MQLVTEGDTVAGIGRCVEGDDGARELGEDGVEIAARSHVSR